MKNYIETLGELELKELLDNQLRIQVDSSWPHIEGFERGFDFAFSRLAIYSTPNREAVIAWARERLRDGGKFMVLDVDHGYICSWPHSDAWQRLFDAMEEEMAPKGADRRIGHKLPHMLLAAGFKDVKLDILTLYSSFEMEPEKFSRLFGSMSLLIHKVMPERFTKEDMDRFLAFIENAASDKTATAFSPFLIASGVK